MTSPAVVKVSPVDLATGVMPDAAVTVKASTGTLGLVTLLDAKGGAVAGRFDPEGTWRATELLRPSTTYTFTVAATGPDGTATSASSRFTTLKPKIESTYGLIPNGGVVGVGMPVIVQFASGVITKAQRAEVEKRVKVTTVPMFATSAHTSRGVDLRSSGRSDLVDVVRAQDPAVQQRAANVRDLQDQVDALAAKAAPGKAEAARLRAEAARLAPMVGTQAVSGPALSVRMDDDKRTAASLGARVASTFVSAGCTSRRYRMKLPSGDGQAKPLPQTYRCKRRT